MTHDTVRVIVAIIILIAAMFLIPALTKADTIHHDPWRARTGGYNPFARTYIPEGWKDVPERWMARKYPPGNCYECMWTYQGDIPHGNHSSITIKNY